MINNYCSDKKSPFQPNNPVSPDRFIGRKKTVGKILRYVNKAIKGETQHFFLTGKDKMGKTSIAKYVADYAESNFNMISVYVSNNGNTSLNNLTSLIINESLNKLHMGDINTNHVFADDFQDYLNEILEELPGDKNGIFIIIDDVDGLAESREFVDWYKRFVDTTSVCKEYNLKVYFLLTSHPDKYYDFVIYEESFASIFHYDTIDLLSGGEIEEFFKNTFRYCNIEISNEALNIMVNFSSGLPLMMQQIGESLFQTCSNGEITENDAFKATKLKPNPLNIS